MSLRALRVDRMKSKIQEVKSNMQPAVAVPSLRTVREKTHLVHADTTKGGLECNPASTNQLPFLNSYFAQLGIMIWNGHL